MCFLFSSKNAPSKNVTSRTSQDRGGRLGIMVEEESVRTCEACRLDSQNGSSEVGRHGGTLGKALGRALGDGCGSYLQSSDG